ncbi:MAG: HAD-IIIC family phosphatase [Thermodesulfovibrionales bacterium]|jgi:FkbH-like protein
MLDVTYAEIQDILNNSKVDHLPRLNISILRNVMVESMLPYVKFLAYKMGFAAEIQMGDYDNIVQESLGIREGILKKETDCVFIFMKLDNLSWGLARKFSALGAQDVQNEVKRIQDTIADILTGVRKQTDGMILWHGFELPLYPNLGIWDNQTQEGQAGVITELNNFLKKVLRKVPNAYYIDLNLCLARMGGKTFYDERYWHIGRAPYSREALREIASEDFKFIRSLKGQSKKCLVLDCDNVLWGGIIGEDGISGIKLSKTYPGSPYYEFQQEVMNLYNRGIIIALCSKNNDEDVREVFRNHPDMVLKEENIATSEINWEDKATNVRKIAANLNIGLDSLVFADDSEFEVNLVREAIPEVTVLHLPNDKTVEYRNILASCGLFETLTVSMEDRERGAMYKAEAQRKQLHCQAADLETYLKSLEMIAEVKFADDFTLPRIAQLTQKTNQFNLTTRRYSEADIKEYMEAESADVLSLQLKDKLGDSGLVGVCILKYIEKEAVIDTFLLSCRVLGRGVEDVFVIQALKLAKKRESEAVIGEFYPTTKNAQVKDFFPKQGFKPSSTSPEEAEGRYLFLLNQPIRDEPSYFKEIRHLFMNKDYQ